MFRVQYFVIAGKEKLVVRRMGEPDKLIDTEGLTAPARIYFLRTKKIFNRVPLMFEKAASALPSLAPLANAARTKLRSTGH